MRVGKMSEKRFTDVTETPKEELECKKKYLYEHSRFWECNDGSKCQILEDDVVDLLNELNKDFEELEISIKLFEDDIATKDKKIEEQQATIEQLQKDKEQLKERLRECGRRLDRFNCR